MNRDETVFMETSDNNNYSDDDFFLDENVDHSNIDLLVERAITALLNV